MNIVKEQLLGATIDEVVDNGATWATQRQRFLTIKYFSREKNFLHLLKNNQFFKWKTFSHPTEKTVLYTYPTYNRFSKPKYLFALSKKLIIFLRIKNIIYFRHV